MRKRFIATIVCSAVGLIGASGGALAETIGRYQCSVIDFPGQEPIDYRPDHFLVSLQYSCFGVDGVLKGDAGVGGRGDDIHLGLLGFDHFTGQDRVGQLDVRA